MSMMSSSARRAAAAVLAVTLVLGGSATVWAQLDPLLFLKRVPPTVIVVMDTSVRMLEDGNGNFYDPAFYSTTADPLVMGAFPGINAGTVKTYRRVYRNLTHVSLPATGYSADLITPSAAVWDPAVPLTSNAPADLAFLDQTRYSIAKRGLAAAVTENAGSMFRWGLLRLRQSTPAWRVSPNCDRPVFVNSLAQLLFGDTNPCNAGGLGRYGIYAPSVAAASYAQASAPAGTVMVTPANATAATIAGSVEPRRLATTSASCLPAVGGVGYEDRPINYALLDAQSGCHRGDDGRQCGQSFLPQHGRRPDHERQRRRRRGVQREQRSGHDRDDVPDRHGERRHQASSDPRRRP